MAMPCGRLGLSERPLSDHNLKDEATMLVDAASTSSNDLCGLCGIQGGACRIVVRRSKQSGAQKKSTVAANSEMLEVSNCANYHAPIKWAWPAP